jgi:excisionase family DNA binding protein
MEAIERESPRTPNGWRDATNGAIGPKLIRRAIVRGELVAYRVGNRFLVYPADFHSWLRRCRVTPPAGARDHAKARVDQILARESRAGTP